MTATPTLFNVRWLLLLALSLGCVAAHGAGAGDRSDIMEHSDDADIVSYPEGWMEQRLEWLQDLKFGALVSWGPCVEWGGAQSWLLSPEERVEPWARPDSFEPWIRYKKDLKAFSAAYFDLYKQFDPRSFDPDDMVGVLREAGIRYAGLTTKHHDGFCLFDTRTTDFKITSAESPYSTAEHADIAKAFYGACQTQGLGTLCYFSKADWHTPYFWNPEFPVTTRSVNYDTAMHPESWEKFKSFTYAQIEELMTGYGRMDILWLDGGQVRPPGMDIDMNRIASMARSHQEGLLIVDRTVGGKYENYITPEQRIPTKPIRSVWEACGTIQKKGWTWRPASEYWSATELIHRLVRIVSDGGNYLIGIGPDAEGNLAPEVLERLSAMGAWLRVNGEGIYKTRRGDFQKNRANPNIVYTVSTDGRTTYLHLLAWPTGQLVVKKPVLPKPGSSLVLLGSRQALDWEVRKGELHIDLSGVEQPCTDAWVIKMTT